MPQQSKLIHSRDEWRDKAIRRGDENREHRKVRKRYRDSIAQLKAHNRALQQIIAAKKNS
ncbi:MAG: hypothetical protein PSU93_06550 [Methylobacter sp.]|uniref:Uncharacterized protein n=1 Tax=Candidatus Methylobacter titanis TaxID=3053457 RepID=A0AA43Q317_9GAMM|nr:hypothetical protein [Candidatus Methylobacter titanis]